MKKLVFSLMMCACALILASCGFKSQDAPLIDSLVTFTAKGTTPEAPKLGVRDIVTEKVLVVPGDYVKITADAYVISCQGADKMCYVFDRTGKPVGAPKFDLFVKMDINVDLYYGKTGTEEFYYFPKGKPFAISCTHSYLSAKNLFIEEDGFWEIYTFDGTVIGNFAKGSWLIKDLKSGDKEDCYILTLSDEKRPGCTITDLSGKVVKKLTASGWQRLQKKLKNKDIINSLPYAEVEDIKKI